MLKKYKIFFVILISLGLMASWSNAFALELNYPTLTFPGGPFNITARTSIIEYARYFFIFFILAVGIIAVISIVYYGAKILLYSTVGNPDAIAEARHNIFGSILGIVLLLFSFILLSTINPELVNLRNSGFVGNISGMYYSFEYDGESYSIGAGSGEMNMQGAIAQNDQAWFWNLYEATATLDNTKLYLGYSCSQPGKNALVWLYNQTERGVDGVKNMKGQGGALNNDYELAEQATNVRTRKFICGNNDTQILLDPANARDNVLSWDWNYEEPGVYFYKTNNCTGLSSDVKKETTGNLDWSNPASVRITNGSDARMVYGLYPLTSDGMCLTPDPIINPTQPTATDVVAPAILANAVSTKCYTINPTPAGASVTSANIFNYRKNDDLDGTAVELDSGYRYATIATAWAKNFNSPAPNGQNPGNPNLYKKYNQNPGQLFRIGNPDPEPGVVASEYSTTTTPANCTNDSTNKACFVKYLRFSYRKSYLVALRASVGAGDPPTYGDNNTRPICRFYTTNAFLPFQDISQYNRGLYRMDIVPIYGK